MEYILLIAFIGAVYAYFRMKDKYEEKKYGNKKIPPPDKWPDNYLDTYKD